MRLRIGLVLLALCPLPVFGQVTAIRAGRLIDPASGTAAANQIILVEGESDSWTLWFHEFPALGIPGAEMTGKMEASHLDGISRLFVVREPGRSGDRFTSGLAKRLRKIGWTGDEK